MSVLEIEGLRAGVAGREILRGIDLTVRSGEVHAVMGPNGSGKSTLSHVLMGRPGYEVLGGSVRLDGRELLGLPPAERAAAGLFLAMQYPTEVPGVALDDMLVAALVGMGRHADEAEVRELLQVEAARIGFDERFLHRPLNVDLSGGEKKRNETLQLAVLRPGIAVLDEIDSGLDVDALGDVSRRIEQLTQDGMGVLVITHYPRVLRELRADGVHIFVRGRFVASGGPELASELEVSGYAAYLDGEDAEAVDGGPLATRDPAAGDPVVDPFADPFADPLA